jgi:4-deoxy-L-threo-5-hexosulose-uronate ketol-isomerase
MFDRTYYATHPDMMEVVSNDELRDRYLISGLFREGEWVLNYTHAARAARTGIGQGASVSGTPRNGGGQCRLGRGRGDG